MTTMQTTIRQYLQNRVPNYTFEDEQLQDFAESPADIGLSPFSLDEPARAVFNTTEEATEFMKRRDYAESCLYYVVVALLGSNGWSEKIGDRSYSSGSVVLAQEDRARFRFKADSLRIKWGLEIEKEESRKIYGGNKYIGMIKG